MSSSIQNLSRLTGMSEAELARRAGEMAQAGQIKSLTTLDAALLANTTGPSKATQDAFGAMAAGNQEPHALEEPAAIMTKAAATDEGFAAGPAASAAGAQAMVSPSMLDKAAAAGTARVQGFMAQGEAIEKIAASLGIDAEAVKGDRATLMELIKMQMQKMNQVFTLRSNVLTDTHNNSKTIINNLKA
jgi:hypothetical protein